MLSKDLQELAKFCLKNGITKIKHNGIELEFGGEAKKFAPRGKSAVKPQEVSKKDVEDVKEEQMANLLMEDPLQYEELLMRN
jgi:MoaA/NifB/PqqE/SkfB family radical SAM enzyme